MCLFLRKYDTIEEKNLQPEAHQQTSTDLVRDVPNIPESPNNVNLDVALCTAYAGECYRSGTVNSSTVNSKFAQFKVNLTGI